ncbi:MAG: TlpA family protein disulfide reductase [Bdellovibrionales bacterium]|nr:TlpA family protein disulfide reductase [Bdellovibrionales bacterium]
MSVKNSSVEKLKRAVLRWGPWVLLLAVVGLQAPRWIKLYRMEGQSVGVPAASAPAAGTLEQALGEPRSKVLVFWASWCGPCTIELKRFASAVRDGDLDAGRVIAVSTDDDPRAYERAVRERGYPFRTFLDGAGLARRLGVEATPTVLHLSAEGRVEYATSGLSLLGVMRARGFLQGE